MTLHPVSISLSSYGADLVRERGQAWFIDVLAKAGVSYIELREELGLPEDMAGLGAAIQHRRLLCVYSSPMQLWDGDGVLQASLLLAALINADTCGARWLKVSLGHYPADADLAPLRALLVNQPVRVLVENDQTLEGGRIDSLAKFFSAARASDISVGMTFDIGNWQWQGQSLNDALKRLSPYVEYVHCKAVQLDTAGKLIATPPNVRDLHLWEQILRHFSPGIVRAIEFPLQGDDLRQITQAQVATLARLGQPSTANHEEVNSHV